MQEMEAKKEMKAKKEMFALIFDAKLTSSNEIVLLETGDIFHSTFERYENSSTEFVRDTILKELAKTGMVYSEHKPSIKIEGLKVCEDILSDVLDGKITEGIVVLCTHITKDHDRTIQLRDYCRQNNKQDIIILNADAILYCQNKLAFKEVCTLAGAPHPKSWLFEKAILFRES
jgi:hypothetical protein